LRGVTDSQCPHCHLDFDWSDVLPVEDLRCGDCGYHLMGAVSDRCPECGGHFRWEDVLGAARSRQSHLFEYFAFRRPIRSLLRTWYLAVFRPKRLWSEYNLHDPPRVFPLLLFVLLQALVFWVSWDAAAAAIEPTINLLNRWWHAPLKVAWNFVYQLRFHALRFYIYAGLWWVATFASFQLFIISKKMYRVQWRQILRVYVHATAFMAFTPALMCLAEMLIDLTYFVAEVPNWGQVVRPWYWWAHFSVLWGGIAVVWAGTWYGYHKYLHMPRGWGIAALSLILGKLLADLAMIYL
jgi:hypothetical protein